MWIETSLVFMFYFNTFKFFILHSISFIVAFLFPIFTITFFDIQAQLFDLLHRARIVHVDFM